MTTKPNFFIQWKGTDVCGDFRCSCGARFHVCNEMFMYRIKCSDCGKVFEVPVDLQLVEVPDDGTPFVLAKDDEDEVGDPVGDSSLN